MRKRRKTRTKQKKLRFYNGQKNLRGINTDEKHPDVKLTKERLQANLRYEDNIILWAEENAYVNHGDFGKVRLKLRDYQLEILELYNENQKILINTSRQAGKSLLLALIVVQFMIYNPDKVVGIISYNQKATKEVLRKAKDIYTKLPLWMQVAVEVWNTERIELSNGAIVLTDIPKDDTLRGESISLLIMDEMDHYKVDEWDAMIRSAMPTMSSIKSHKGVYSSTPKGYKQMYKMYKDIKSGKLTNYGYIEVPYTRLPHADDEWVKTVKNDIPDETNREQIFQQEYNNKFILMSNSVFPQEVLASYESVDPIINDNNQIMVYEKPVAGDVYATGVDLSDGVGGDYAVITTMNISRKPYKIAKIWRRNEFTHGEMTNAIISQSKEYNNSMTTVERNNMGKIMIDLLLDNKFANLVSFDSKKYGFYTLKGSKVRIIDNLKTYMLNGWIDIKDLKTISELGTFIKKANGSFGASKTNYDDVAMSLMLCLSITLHRDFEEYNIAKFGIDETSVDMDKLAKRQIIIF